MNGYCIFDLDNTLADTNHLKSLRDSRRWNDVYAQIDSVKAFPGVLNLWQELASADVHLSIVTHSPRSYAERVLDRLGIAPTTLVAYHDLNGQRKPSAFGYRKACNDVLHLPGIAIGDDRNDLLAADALPTKGVLAGWGRQLSLTLSDCSHKGWRYAPSPEGILEIATELEIL